MNKKNSPIHDEDDSLILQTKLSDLASNKLIEILDDDISSLTYQLQDESLVSYAKKIKKEEAVINWNENCSDFEFNRHTFNFYACW